MRIQGSFDDVFRTLLIECRALSRDIPASRPTSIVRLPQMIRRWALFHCTYGALLMECNALL